MSKCFSSISTRTIFDACKEFSIKFVVCPAISVCAKVARWRSVHPALYLALVSVDNTVQIPLTRPMLALCGEGVSSPRGLHEKCERQHRSLLKSLFLRSFLQKFHFQWTLLFPPLLILKETFSFRDFSSFDIFQKFRCM